MNIADKLKKIAENEPKVYEAGYNIGFAKGETNENNFFWARYQHHGSRDSYSYAFFGTGWNDATYNPQYDIYTEPKIDRARYMFAWSGIVDTKVPIEINGGTNSSGLPVVEEGIFLGCKRLIIIRELYINNYNATYNRWFEGCESLTKITIKGQIKNNGFDIHWSKDLTAESIDSIVGALTTEKSGLTITLPAGAYNRHAKRYGASVTKALWAEKKAHWSINELAV